MTIKQKIAVIGTASAILVLLVSGLFIWNRCFRIYYGYEPLEFSKEAWDSADPEPRGHMVKDFLKKHKLKGMTYEKVTALLGQPDDDKELNADSAKTFSINYDLGLMGYNPNAILASPRELIILFEDNRVIFHLIND